LKNIKLRGFGVSSASYCRCKLIPNHGWMSNFILLDYCFVKVKGDEGAKELILLAHPSSYNMT
jgi:hypothetical protein